MSASPTRPSSGRFEPTPRYALERAVTTLGERAASWVDVPLDDKVAYLRSIIRRTMTAAPALIRESLEAKGIPPSMAGEEWVAGPLSVVRTVRFLAETLQSIERTGRTPVPERRIKRRRSGQVTVGVLPADRWDRVLYPGWTADVWMDPEVERRDARRHMGAYHTKPETARTGVALTLGAGNVSSIVALDIVDKLFAGGEVVIAKFSPVNDYVGPHLESAFADLIADGFVRTVYGGEDVGGHLAHHSAIGSVHITGGVASHDRLVFGDGEDGARRKQRNEPILTKPVTSELGNVSPVIVVPGEWKTRELRYQAEHVATQMVQNAGFNCNAAKVLVAHRGWPQREAFLDEVRSVLRSYPVRPAYYPGAEDAFERFLAAYPAAELLGERGPGIVPPTVAMVDAGPDEPAFGDEVFCSVMAVTDLPGGGPAEFLERAVLFCNDQLAGSLNATLVIDPTTEKALGPAVDDAIAGLRYGAVGVNVWAAAAFPLGVTTWGAFPGHTPDDIQSGVGVVHNARLIDRPQKSVVRAPFFQFPKPAWFVTHRRAAATLRRATAFEADPGVGKLPGLLAAAVRQ